MKKFFLVFLSVFTLYANDVVLINTSNLSTNKIKKVIYKQMVDYYERISIKVIEHEKEFLSAILHDYEDTGATGFYKSQIEILEEVTNNSKKDLLKILFEATIVLDISNDEVLNTTKMLLYYRGGSYEFELTNNDLDLMLSAIVSVLQQSKYNNFEKGYKL